ncbi:MAG: hypothetical protein M3T55_07455 [Pseudomonadota bacterium]|nr:hypothetical protein [Pseudomonadota bacterium]
MLTIDLPANVVKGQEFNIVIRRIGSLRVTIAPPPPPPPPPPRIAIARRPAANRAPQPMVAAVVNDVRIERYVVGSFQVKIPVKTKSDMLGPEETTLAIVKARLAAMPKSSRWYPVIERYLGLLIARVDGLGGEASEIGPSFAGYSAEQPGGDGHDPGRGHGHGCEDRWEEHTGKIAGIIFDHFGDFEGFVLDLPEGERRFASREREIRKLAVRAWAERLRVTVLADPRAPHRPLRFIMRGLPEAF